MDFGLFFIIICWGSTPNLTVSKYSGRGKTLRNYEIYDHVPTINYDYCFKQGAYQLKLHFPTFEIPVYTSSVSLYANSDDTDANKIGINGVHWQPIILILKFVLPLRV